MKLKQTLLLLLVLPICSCSLILGINEPKLMTNEQILNASKKFNIPSNNSYTIDTLKYSELLKEVKLTKPRLYQNLLQPLQIRVFIKSDSLEVFLVNCNVGGLFKLQWNRAGSFNQFPPIQGSINKPDTIFSFSSEIGLYKQLTNPILNSLSFSDSTIVVVYWSSYTYRYTRQLLTLIKKYQIKYKTSSLKIIYVNIDNLTQMELVKSNPTHQPIQ